MRNSKKFELTVIENEITVFAPAGATGRQYQNYLDATKKERAAIKKGLPAKKRRTKKTVIETAVVLKRNKGCRGKNSRKATPVSSFRMPVVKQIHLMLISTPSAKPSTFGFFATGDRGEVLVNIMTPQKCVVIDTYLNTVSFRSYAEINTMYFENIQAKPADFKMISKDAFEMALYQQILSFTNDTAIKVENLNLRNV